MASDFKDKLAAVKGFRWGFMEAKRYGYIDSQGRNVIAAKFAWALDFCGGLAVVNVGGEWKNFIINGGKWGYIDKSGTYVVSPMFDYATNFSQGLAAVKQDGLFGYIDPSGHYVIERRFGYAEAFCEGVAEVRLEFQKLDSIAYINTHGTIIWPRK